MLNRILNNCYPDAHAAGPGISPDGARGHSYCCDIDKLRYYLQLSRKWDHASYTVVWNGYLLFFFDKNVIFYFIRRWKPSANNEIWCTIKVLTRSKTLNYFCWKFSHFQAVYWWLLQIQICGKMTALFIFHITDYTWISIMLFDLCLKVVNKILLMADVSFA